jgi:hypothetical protein
MTAEIAPRDLHSAIVSQSYNGHDSIRDAGTMQRKMAAAVEVARRAGADEEEYRRLAREAERALGRMLLAARERGDLAEGKGHRKANVGTDDISTLADLGIARDLAADAVLFTRLPNDTWSDYLAQVATRTGLASLARQWADEADRFAKAEAEQQRKLTELAEHASDLHALVADGLAVDEAWAAYEKRTQEKRERDAEIAKGIRTSNFSVAECVYKLAGYDLDGGVNRFLNETYPRHAEFVEPGMRLTPERVAAAARFLERLAEKVRT